MINECCKGREKCYCKCDHEWYFDQYENGNYLRLRVEGNCVYCSECGKEWFE